jgi:lipid-A-disaccharide synthase
MKKIFILTGEPSGDKLAAKVISQLKSSRTDIEYLSVGGEYLNNLGIPSLYNLKEVTYLGFTKVLINIFKIKKKINESVKEIIKYNPDILFSVDSPDFTLRIAKEIKKKKPNIKTIHFVAPQIWVWRKKRIKKFKSYLDHVLLLFPFEKKIFDNEEIQSTFTGHPLLEEHIENKIDISKIVKDNKRVISIYPGSRLSEVNVLTPILLKFIAMMNGKYNDLFYIFHATKESLPVINKLLLKAGLSNCSAITDEETKLQLLKSSIFAVAKSGTISLEICKEEKPSIIIYKMGIINFFIIKLLVNVKFANIINIAANDEIIPELLQSNCKPINIFNTVDKYLSNENLIENQLERVKNIVDNFKTQKSSKIACSVIEKYL